MQLIWSIGVHVAPSLVVEPIVKPLASSEQASKRSPSSDRHCTAMVEVCAVKSSAVLDATWRPSLGPPA
jgi:hypothetical protein